MTTTGEERARRWRLILGGAEADGTGHSLGEIDLAIDQTLAALYAGEGEDRRAGLGGSSPRVARWLGDIRTYFPSSVVRVMQKDALERLELHQMLLEPELLDSVDADVHLVASLVALSGVMPQKSKDTARRVIRKVVDELMKRLEQKTRRAVRGALNRAARVNRPRHADIDWQRTIRANLRHYVPEHRTVIPERRIGFGRRQHAQQRDIILCMDQSGSMATSVVYAGIFGGVLASIPSVRTRVVAFDTSVVDLTEKASDPVEILFGVQLGGGTDINRAVAYCEQHIARPRETVLVLITDLFEGGDRKQLLQRSAAMVASGVNLVVLVALNDDGKPAYDHELAADFAALGVPAFACTPDRFPDLMAAAIERRDLRAFAAASER
ncbi:MAG: VWA domain-containing protein [Phycisphaerales bacterium]|nr:VWA domain-containing protein [Phycisphaerales bacterium]